MKTFKIFSIFIFVLISGCIAAPMVKYDIYNQNDAGFALISVSAQKFVGSFNIYIRKKGQEGDTPLATMIFDNGFYSSSAKFDYQDDVSRGVIGRFLLEPGVYEVYGYKISAAGGYGVPSEFKNVEFEVKLGKISYVGNFYFEDTRSGLFKIKNTIFHLKNEIDRDLSLAYDKYPDLKNKPTIESPPLH